MIGYVTWFQFLQNVALIAAPVAIYWGLTFRKRLHLYEDRQGNPFIISPSEIADHCPECDGVLQQAIMEDDWGPDLHLSSARRVRSDGTPVFESHWLNSEESQRLYCWRGVGQGFWCERCRQFFLAKKMTKEQIVEAQRLSTAFKPTKTP